ncbi:MAG: DUF4154 domain-containing protein, partial [Bacteroidales bacterium]|nr:DUF4154 domain-containing protein [Bacteroidales bacterium]
MNTLRKYIQLTFLSFILLPGLLAQVEEAQIIAAYINNFAHYISWPDENQIDSFKIVVFTQNTDILNEFQAFSQKRRIKDKPVILSEYGSDPDLKEVQIVLLARDKSDNLPEIYNAIEGKPVLLVSEDYQDKRNIMINLYKTQQQQLLFEINKANIINQNLVIDPEILLAGGTEIDVAGLYRNSQLNLRKMQKDMDKMSDSLEHLHLDIQLSLNQINQQQLEISKQKKLLAERTEKLDYHQKIILSQQVILASQKDSIDHKNRILHEQMQEAGDMEQFLKAKQEQIELLNRAIEDKNIVLGDQTKTIVHQKQMLALSIIVGVLSFFLVITVFISYRSNKIKKDILAKQKSEIENRLIELKELNVKLEEADQYKSIFLASMSHELRTPLNSIIGYTGILLMGMTGTLNEEQNKQLNKVKNNARHLLSLINDILDISKIEADRVELHYEEFNLKNLVNEIVETIHPKVVEKQLEMIAEIPDDLIVTTDIRRIKQVVLNLVSNAVNYTDAGKIQIHADRLPGDKIRLAVKDTGIGIPENEIPKLFQPFQQIDSSLTKKNKGTGLGLYLCKKLMTLLKGDIFVK